MKNLLNISTASLFTLLVLLASACKVSTENDPGQGSAESASFKAGAVSVAVTDPYNGISSNNGVISNQVSLPGKDGSKVSIYFKGSTPATYPLKTYSDAYYKSASSTQYNAVRGEINVTSYKIQGAAYTFSGTFNFVAKSPSNPKDSIIITGGVINNCTNNF